MDIIVRCVANNGDGNRNVVVFEPTYQADEEVQAEGRVSLTLVDKDEDTDAGADFEVGKVYTLSLAETSVEGDPFKDTATLAAQAAAIPNATNTRGYKTPAEQKVPVATVPDGVVTMPRPAVVLSPLSNVPPDAGVAAPATTAASGVVGGSTSSGAGNRTTTGGKSA